MPAKLPAYAGVPNPATARWGHVQGLSPDMAETDDAREPSTGYRRFVARQPRSALPSEGVYHVTSRGVDRCAIYRDDEDRMLFLGLLRRVSRSREWVVHAYCLMGNHYHVVVETTLDRLSLGCHRLNGSHAQHFNERHGRVGHLFQSRFHARVLGDDEHLTDACAYTWNNPVRAGLCDTADQWPWNGRVV
jgi:REP element-mobilizing transposase RayT